MRFNFAWTGKGGSSEGQKGAPKNDFDPVYVLNSHKGTLNKGTENEPRD